MDTDGTHYSQYDPTATDLLIAEAAALMRAFSFAAQHLTLIGGIVPGLLIPQLDPGIERHVGTTDLDMCLSIALVEGDTAEYEKLEVCLRKAGFSPTEQSWRWRGGAVTNVTVEFFCPDGPGRMPGKAFRPGGTDNPRARANLGPKLSALPLSAGALIGKDTRLIEREVTLPNNQGRATVELRITGPGAFLAAKAAALKGRNKPKDSYDIVWLLDAWEDGPIGLAESILAQPIFGDPLLLDTFAILDDQFRDVDRVGAVGHASFLRGSGDEHDILAMHAVTAVREFLRHVRNA